MNRDERVIEEGREARPLVLHVAERRAHRALRFEERRDGLSPIAKSLEHRRTSFLAQREMLGGADDVSALGGALHHEELEDDVESLPRFWRCRERIEEMTARVAPAARALAAVDVSDDVVARVPVDGQRASCAAEDILRRLAAARRAEDVDGVQFRQERP